MTQIKNNFLIRYIGEVKEELKKVTWPNRTQVQNTAIVIVILSVCTALFFGGLDFIFNYLLKLLIA